MFDDKALANTVSDHLENTLPEEFRGIGVIQHYHSGMSEQYLWAAHQAFTNHGVCKILCAISGESMVRVC